MGKKFIVTAFAIAFLHASSLQAQTAVQKTMPRQPAQKQQARKKNETFLEWVVRFSGVSANSNTLKGADNDLESGQLWIADLRSDTRKRITTGSDYRSPVFYPDSAAILVLKDSDVVRMPFAAGYPAKLCDAAGVTKLIGFNRDDPDQVLLLKEGAGEVSVGLLSVSMAKITLLPYDLKSSRDHEMIEHLQDWQRTYGDKSVYVKSESRHEMSGAVERSNIFLKTPGQEPQNVSHCESVNCGEPALSPDGNQVVFIKAEP